MNLNDLIIIGSSGLAKECYGIVKSINKLEPTWSFKGFVSNETRDKIIVDGFRILGNDEWLLQESRKCHLILAIGNSAIRESVFRKCGDRSGFFFPNIIHKSATIDCDNSTFGIGNIIAPNVVISTGVCIGDFNIINVTSMIAHDVSVGSFNTINPYANISGNIAIANNCTIGSSSVLHQGVKVRNGTIIGMGGVLTRSTRENSTYLGNPARLIGETNR